MFALYWATTNSVKPQNLAPLYWVLYLESFQEFLAKELMHQVYVIDVFWGLYSESCLEEGQQEPNLHILLQPQDLLKDAGTVVKEELDQVSILAVKELRIDEAVKDREYDLVKDIHPGLKAILAIGRELPAKVRDSDREILLSNLPTAPDERTDIPLPL